MRNKERGIYVELTAYEMFQAAAYGVMRSIEDIKLNRPNRFGAKPEEGWQISVEGTMGECVVAKAFDIYWNGNLGDLKAPDVGDLHVRTTPYKTGRLILHKPKKDNPNDYYILVTGINGKYYVRGGLMAFEGQFPQYWTQPNRKKSPAYFVPQDRLDDIEFVRGIVALLEKRPAASSKAIPWLN